MKASERFARRLRRAKVLGHLDSRLILVLLLLDALAVPLAFGLAFLLRVSIPFPWTQHLLPIDRMQLLQGSLAIGLLTQLPLLFFSGLYDPAFLRRPREATLAVGLMAVFQLLLISAWFFFAGGMQLPRSVLLLFSLFNMILLVGFRIFAHQVLWSGSRVLRVALVGPEMEICELESILRAQSGAGEPLRIVGAVRSDGPAEPGEKVKGSDLRWLGTVQDLGREVRSGALDKVIVAPAESWKDKILEGVLRETEGVPRALVAVVPSFHELLVGRLTGVSVENVPMIDVSRNPERRFGFSLKSGVDFSLAILLLVVSLPVLLGACLAIRISSSGPVLFRQRRVGKGGAEFIIYKLRTMREGAEDGVGAVLATPDDSRVIGVGRFLRATRIDEIPQLLNVLNGTMSLVGPRPERPELTEAMVREIPGYAERWLVKPGLSGLAQVRGEYSTSPAYKLKYDLAYIHNYSLQLDLRIMAETVRTLITRRGV
ncbi:MAG: sugar transferase [Candidatus Binatia bacterium]|nr:sugar transferase [Candidatus Binatia bacterium]MDG2011819.1 sugar transferase [Candidatus Binatia bacterium]